MFGWFLRKADAQERTEPSLGPGVRAEAEAISLGNTDRLSDLFGGGPASSAGVRVTPERSMRTTAVYAAVRLITGSIASLPLAIYRRDAAGQRARIDHRYGGLINQTPNAHMTAALFWKYMVTAELLGGDQIAMIGRAGGGTATELYPYDPRMVSIEERDGRLVYFFNRADGKYMALDQDDVLHIPGEGYNTRTHRGMSVIAYAARQAIGISIAADEYSGEFFANGARPDIALTYPVGSRPDPEKLRDYWTQRHAGPGNRHKPAVLLDGGDIKQIQMSAEDTQLLETRMYQVIDIARAFGVPPVLIGESEKTSSWGKGVEQILLAFVKFTLRNHLTKIEQELNRKLFRAPGVFCEFNIEGLLRGDSEARRSYYREAIGGSMGPGWMTINEVRRLDNLPPLADGEKLFRPEGNSDEPTTS